MSKRSHAARPTSRQAGACIIAACLTAFAANAASEDGQYAVRGLGSTSCGAFLETIEAEGSLPVSYVSWMSGYISALNRLEPDTFDVSYITQNDSMLALVGRVCTADRDILLETAVARLVNLMRENRVETENNFLRVQVGEQQVMIRQSVYDNFVAVLVDQGFLESPMGFSEPVRDAILAFQEARGLARSGLPDENTLITAFSSPR